MAGTQTYKHHAWHGRDRAATVGQLQLVTCDMFFLWCFFLMVFGDVRFRMKRMEWGWEKKTSSNKTGLILLPSMLLGKNNSAMTTDVCYNHQEDLLLYDHVMQPFGMQEIPSFNFDFKATIFLGLFTPNLRHSMEDKTLLLMLTVNINNTDLAAILYYESPTQISVE